MVSVLLAIESRMVRSALAVVVDLDPDLNTVGEVDRAETLLKTTRRCRPDVVVLDADMANGSVIAFMADLNAHFPGARTLLITSRRSPELLRRVMMLNAAGLLLKDSSAAELVESVKAVAVGRQIVDQGLAIAALNAQPNPLSGREVDILLLAAAGAEPAEIAKRLSLRIGTVRNYLSTIVTKLDARNRVDAIRIADESGWLLPRVEATPHRT